MSSMSSAQKVIIEKDRNECAMTQRQGQKYIYKRVSEMKLQNKNCNRIEGLKKYKFEDLLKFRSQVLSSHLIPWRGTERVASLRRLAIVELLTFPINTITGRMMSLMGNRGEK